MTAASASTAARAPDQPPPTARRTANTPGYGVYRSNRGSVILQRPPFLGYIAVVKFTAATTLAELATDQWGLVTSRQVKDAGVPTNTWQRLAARGDLLERVAHGVYRFRVTAPTDHLDLRAAWLQLAPAVWAWDRTPEQGVVSHRSAASLFGLGHLPAVTHEFTVSGRRQSRRPDVRIHRRRLAPDEITKMIGLPVTRPARIASDLLAAHEDPESIGQVVADAIRGDYERPRAYVPQLAKHASRFGLRRGDGVQLLRWLLDLVGDARTPEWMAEARTVAPVSSALVGTTRDEGTR